MTCLCYIDERQEEIHRCERMFFYANDPRWLQNFHNLIYRNCFDECIGAANDSQILRECKPSTSRVNQFRQWVKTPDSWSGHMGSSPLYSSVQTLYAYSNSVLTKFQTSFICRHEVQSEYCQRIDAGIHRLQFQPLRGYQVYRAANSVISDAILQRDVRRV